MSYQIFHPGVRSAFCWRSIQTSERHAIALDSLMTAKPSYEELEKLVTSLSQEVATCRNLQRFLHQAASTAIIQPTIRPVGLLCLLLLHPLSGLPRQEDRCAEDRWRGRPRGLCLQLRCAGASLPKPGASRVAG